jgi:hypothetical protein
MATPTPETRVKMAKIDAKDVETLLEKYKSISNTAAGASNLPVPTETPQHYSHWLPLLAASQRIPSELIQILKLSRK